jgi:L-fuconate dehydratase
MTSYRQTRLLFSLQEELVKSATFRYITDAITPDEVLAILKAKEATKGQRETIVRSEGCVWRSGYLLSAFSPIPLHRYPAYVTSAGWLGILDGSPRAVPSISLTRCFFAAPRIL